MWRKIRVSLFHDFGCAMLIHAKAQKQVVEVFEFVDSLTLASAFGI